MQAFYPACFEREVGCTQSEWLMWLPGAVGEHALTLGEGCAQVAVAEGGLSIRWEVLSPRRIALVSLPRLHVSFGFEGVGAEERRRFMRYFDLYMQRGGG